MGNIKNIDIAKVHTLKEQIGYQIGQVVSKTLAQNNKLSITLFSFDKGEEISTHESEGDALVICLDGIGEITIDDKKHELHEGETIVMPAKHPHRGKCAVLAQLPLSRTSLSGNYCFVREILRASDLLHKSRK